LSQHPPNPLQPPPSSPCCCTILVNSGHSAQSSWGSSTSLNPHPSAHRLIGPHTPMIKPPGGTLLQP
jgi:hypothetical protein